MLKKNKRKLEKETFWDANSKGIRKAAAGLLDSTSHSVSCSFNRKEGTLMRVSMYWSLILKTLPADVIDGASNNQENTSELRNSSAYL